MADSEKSNENKEEKLGAVLQLAPNKKNTQQASITKDKNEELVSLDELYEESGQEAINKFLEGFNLLVNSNRLSRQHGAVLQVRGFENWLELPDALNAYKGGEDFLDAIKKGIVAVVKSIVALIRGLTNWVSIRIRSLIKYVKPVDDAIFIHKSSDEYRRLAVSFLKDLGVSNFDEKEFLESLPPNLTTSEILTITKTKLDNSEKSFERVREANAYIKDYVKLINDASRNLKDAKNEYDLIIGKIKTKIKSNDVTIADVKEINLGLTSIMDRNLNPLSLVDYLDGLLKILYGINLEGIGLNNNFKLLRDKIEKISEEAKLTYNKKLFEQVNSLTLDLYKNLYKGAEYGNSKLDLEIVSTLNKFVDENNSALIEKISELSNDNKLAGTYIEFCNRITVYPTTIEVILLTIQRVESSIVSIMKWHSYLNDIIIAYVTRNIAQLAEISDKLPIDVRKKLDANKSYFYGLPELDKTSISEEVSKKAAKLFSSTKGKELLQYYSGIGN